MSHDHYKCSVHPDKDFIFLCWLVFETIGRKLAAQSNDQQLKRFFMVVDGLCLIGGVICVLNHISGWNKSISYMIYYKLNVLGELLWNKIAIFGQYSKSLRSLLFIRSSKGLQNLILAIHDSRVGLDITTAYTA